MKCGSGVSPAGLSTVDALRLLHDELHQQVHKHKRSLRLKARHKAMLQRFRDSFLYHGCGWSLFKWTSCAAMLITCVLLLTAYSLQINRDSGLVVEAVVILLLLVVNLCLSGWISNLRTNEIIKAVEKVLQILQDCMETGAWSPSSYVDLHAPLAPSVTLQWAYRDGELVNLPQALLVAGDTIVLRPGQVIPANCRPMWSETDSSMESFEYKRDNIFKPEVEDVLSHSCCNQPRARVPLRNQLCIVTVTPFSDHLEEILEDGLRRPLSVQQNERHQVYSIWMEQRIIPLFLLLSLAVNTIRYMLLQDSVGHWTTLLISLQVHVVLPLLPLLLPVLWSLVDCYGTARVLTTYHIERSRESCQISELDSENDLHHNLHVQLSWQDIWKHCLEIMWGKDYMLAQTANVMQVLGCVTALSCIDKKGLLSWPNPSAEKVFFLHQPQQKEESPEAGSDGEDKSDVWEDEDGEDASLHSTVEDTFVPEFQQPFVEVLDLTHNKEDGQRVQFTDVGWKRHISSLKPLGLNILLNACNPDNCEDYSLFADHLTCAAFDREDVAIPVVNRRCFCELARQIGFTDQAKDIFEMEKSLGMYRQVPENAALQETSFRNKTFIKHRTPIPNMFSVVVQEARTGMLQLLSQGTGDLILDACSDFWNGSDLCPLSDAERKKINDFYHRTSMASYCTAFSYRPLTQTIGEELSGLYLELPEDMKSLYPMLSHASQSEEGHSVEPYGSAWHYGSADSVMMANSVSSVHDIEGCLKAQCNQVFIGMITMQYQVKQDVVKLIEELEQACIRFVYFSKENELRSRVFSEKMGLEAGWNCHISLLSEKKLDLDGQVSQADLHKSDSLAHPFSRHSAESVVRNHSASKIQEVKEVKLGRRSSAPGSFSLETAQVKFELSDSHRPQVSRKSPPSHTQITNTKSEEEPDDMMDDPEMRPTSPLLGNEASNSINKPKSPQYANALSSRSPKRHTFHEEPVNDLESSPLVMDGEDGFPERQHLSSLSSSESYPASSYVTENTDSVTGGLGLSNRAKLPKGIENIRSHIDTVDNVPLLVSLFTDCTSNTTREMLHVLQDYGEVVCVVGSSSNILNTGSFLQADCSIAIEPQYPEVCLQCPHDPQPSPENTPSPMEVASLMQNIPCSLAFHRTNSITLIQLITEARHHCLSVKKSFLFLLMSSLGLSLLQLLCHIMLFPPILAAPHLLWLVCLILPCVCLSLMGNPVDTTIMTCALGKNKGHVPRKAVLTFMAYFVIKWLPSLLVCLLCHGFILAHFCQLHARPANASCHLIFGRQDHTEAATWRGWTTEYAMGLRISQSFVLSQLVFYIVCNSLSNVHEQHQLWQKRPFDNRLWCITAPCIVLAQVLFFVIDYFVQKSSSSYIFYISEIPLSVWVISFIWPLLLIPLNELIKRREIKLYVRFQKRARLDFGTKLGMNSPF